VVEVDESDGTIGGFNPDITLVLNYDWDHVDEYKEENSLEHTLQDLLSRTKTSVVLPEKSGLLSWAEEKLNVDVSSFETNHTSADFMFSNWAAAKACGSKMGARLREESFKSFPGMERRQSVLFEDEHRTILEDYAHHPTEIGSLLAMRRKLLPDHWMKVVFQSHRYSRTKAFAQSFAEELGAADELNLLPTYGAFEKYDVSGDAESLVGYLPPRLRDKNKSIF
jgi:UDP-N-acetylmuramate-alanine ligase